MIGMTYYTDYTDQANVLEYIAPRYEQLDKNNRSKPTLLARQASQLIVNNGRTPEVDLRQFSPHQRSHTIPVHLFLDFGHFYMKSNDIKQSVISKVDGR